MNSVFTFIISCVHRTLRVQARTGLFVNGVGNQLRLVKSNSHITISDTKGFHISVGDEEVKTGGSDSQARE